MEHLPASAPVRCSGLADVISTACLSTLRDHGVIEAYVFGSVADGIAGPASDIDLPVALSQPAPLFAQLRLASELQRISGRRVDLMTDIHLVFRSFIEPTLLRLPL